MRDTFSTSSSYRGYGAEEWAISYDNFAAFGGDARKETDEQKVERIRRERDAEWAWLREHGLDKVFMSGITIVMVTLVISLFIR